MQKKQTNFAKQKIFDAEKLVEIQWYLWQSNLSDPVQDTERLQKTFEYS